MNEQHTYQILTTTDGQTVPAKVPTGVTIDIVVNGQSSEKQVVNISHDEFAALQQKVVSHHIQVDAAGNVTIAGSKQHSTGASAQ
jgi:hypothetical protein